tara:strand:+ start:54 stop:542 length:489 start_codon:yes stop_codon:yes gene_type:complete
MFGNNNCSVVFGFNYGLVCYDAEAICDSKLIALPACLEDDVVCKTVFFQEQLDSEWLESSSAIAKEDFSNTEAKEQFMTALVSYVAVLYRTRRGDMATDLAAEVAKTFIPEGDRGAWIANTLFRADGLVERHGYMSVALELPKLPAARQFVKLSSIGKYYFE